MRLFHEGLFDSVAVVYPVANEEEAVRLADSAYGLEAVIRRITMYAPKRLAGQLEVGVLSINEGSGSARELGPDGMAEFVNRKLMNVNN